LLFCVQHLSLHQKSFCIFLYSLHCTAMFMHIFDICLHFVAIYVDSTNVR
jgi:hypothetical protein